MGFTKSLVTAWLASQAIVAAANAAEPVRSHGTPAAQTKDTPIRRQSGTVERRLTLLTA